MVKQNSFFNKQEHADAEDEEKTTEAQHRALAAMAAAPSSIPNSPSISSPVAAPSIAAPVPTTLSSAPGKFPGLAGILAAHHAGIPKIRAPKKPF